jgi:von Willebrand factor type A domain
MTHRASGRAACALLSGLFASCAGSSARNGPHNTGDASLPDGATARADGGISSERADAGPAVDVELGSDGCGEQTVRTLSIRPTLLILLDRSRSMQGGGPPADLRCKDLSLLDVERIAQCGAAGIDCNSSQDRDTVYCGGTVTRGSVERWAPSVSAVKSLTSELDPVFSLGLMTFPALSNGCGPGELRVPVGAGRAADIAAALDATKVGGGTPTGETLAAAAALFRDVPPSSVTAPRNVLLVTDGKPTCPNARSNDADVAGVALDRAFAVAQVDALRGLGVQTYVVGYDAALDPELSSALSELAQHGGTERYFPVEDEATLLDAFNRIAGSAATCEFRVRSQGLTTQRVDVRIDGVPVPAGSPDGFEVRDEVVHLLGAACATLKARPAADVTLSIPCEVLL